MSSPSSAGSPEAHANNAEDQPPAPGSEADLDNSFFPSPPAFYKRYTTASLALPPSAPLPAIEGLLACTAAELEPPNPEWIVEGGAYQVFGETWPVEEVLPTLEEMGVTEMFVRGADRLTSLQTLLRALLLSYTSLVASLLSPPPSLSSLPFPLPDGSEPPTDPERLVEHIRLISINMHHLVNELRPVQARETLKRMMRAQIDQRRAKTAAIKQKCEELTAALSATHENVISQSAPPSVSARVRQSSRAEKTLRDVKVEQVEWERLKAVVDRMDED